MAIRSLDSTILMKRINGDYPDVTSLIPRKWLLTKFFHKLLKSYSKP